MRADRRHFLKAGTAVGFLSLFHDAFAFSDGAGLRAQDGCLLCRAISGQALPADPRRRMAGPVPRSRLLASASSCQARSQSAGKTIIIQPGWVLVPDGDKLKVLHDHDVVIKGDLIEGVRPRKPGIDQRIAAQGQIMLPGFISGHTHSAAGTMTRGFIEENSFASVQTDDPSIPSRSLLRPMVKMEALSDGELDDLTALNLLEMLRSGCTTQVEMSLSLKQVKSYVRVAGRFGIRGYPSGMVPGMTRLLSIWGRTDDQVLLDSIPETLAEIEANLAFARNMNGAQDGRIQPMMGPSVVSVHTRGTFEAIRNAALELGNGIHLHIQNGWDANDRAGLQRIWGKREIAIIQEMGLFDAGLFGAHLLGIDLEKDLPILARNKFTFAYCPSAAGAAVLPSSQPYAEAVAAGVNTCIGLDTHSNDYLENIKLGVMQGRARAQLLGATSPVPLAEPTIWTGLESATRGGARGLNRADLGRIEPGAKADLCTVDVSGLLVGNGAVPREPWNNLLYANGLSVRHVMTDGNWQFIDGKFMVGDPQQVVARGAAVVQKVWSELEGEGFFVPMPH